MSESKAIVKPTISSSFPPHIAVFASVHACLLAAGVDNQTAQSVAVRASKMTEDSVSPVPPRTDLDPELRNAITLLAVAVEPLPERVKVEAFDALEQVCESCLGTSLGDLLSAQLAEPPLI